MVRGLYAHGLRDVLAAKVTTWGRARCAPRRGGRPQTADAAGLPAPPALLTGRRRRAARPASDKTRVAVPTKRARPPRRCIERGIEVGANRRRCDRCPRRFNHERLVTVGRAEADRRRAAGEHPSARLETRERIAASHRAACATAHPGGELVATRNGHGPVTGLLRVGAKRKAHSACRHWAAFRLAGLQTGG